ncbi:MAG: UvrD-helicase domain-containing protein [Prevotellaceae bacterium]|jgi:ATP-dependent exoDNAse (exonuclease V) beta subunit|nr:UvrD-helicase domain-containing protein [Prevotellaceae bacterium]
MELLVYKASAGSGKTFTLAVEYIKLLILNPGAYRQILAVTFTNKATGEMKERILQQLYGIWKGHAASEPYLRRIAQVLPAPGMTDNDIRQAAGTALHYMLHDYSRFRIETIDSFFQSVLRNLARELELTPNLAIELNNTDVLSEAVDSLIEKLTPTSPVLLWLLEYIGERIADDKRWDVSHEIKRFGRNIFDEGYMERGDNLRQQLRDANLLRTYRNELRGVEQEALGQMKTFAERFSEALARQALTPEELAYGKNGVAGYFLKIAKGILSDKKVLGTRVTEAMDDAARWVKKNHPRGAEIRQLAQQTLIPLLKEAEAYRSGNNRLVNSCRLSLQHLNKLQLLVHIDQEVRLLNYEKNRFLLSDTNALLHRVVGDADSSFVFEKIGASIRNVMMDEFQDTSRLQWDNFRILLTEGLSQGADSLIVGDVKQSIYRWRNGDWRILNELGSAASSSEKFPFPIRVETLQTNRRSQENIIRFNNSLFTAAVAWLNEKHFDELQEHCLPLLRAYADVEQVSPQSDHQGYVSVCFLQPDDEHDYVQQTLLALGQEIEHLMAAGIRADDLTILVRKNKNIPLIADYVEQELHLPIVSDEAFRLDASQALCLLVEALRYLADPTDSVARAALGETVLSERLPLAQLWGLPLYELVETLYERLELARIPKQEAYLFAFFDAVTEYVQTHASDIASFVRYWEEKLASKTIPGGDVEGIRILSIHKSKGLEFHTVLVPFCDWKLENETTGQLVWCTPKQAPFNRIDLVPVTYSTLMAESVYRADYLQERLQLWVDNLNLLYVAFTRASKNLFVWSKAAQKGTVSELLAASLELPDGQNQYSLGSLYIPSRSEAASSSGVPVEMSVQHPALSFRQSNRSADFIAGIEDTSSSPRRFLDRGRLLHTLFADIATLADVEPAIDRLLFEGVIATRRDGEELRELTRGAFALPQVRSWYSGEWRLMTERDILWTDPPNRLNTRRPDRVMMRGDETVVVDFKFGHPHPQYARQMQDYLSLMLRMGYDARHLSGYLWYVTESRIEQIPIN